jgi:putative transposase
MTMARQARRIEIDKEGFYHLRGQVAGGPGFIPLRDREARRRLTEIVRHYTELFFCETAAYEPMDTHYHLTVRFEAYHPLTREALLAHAERFYPGRYRPYKRWNDRQWERFNRRLFNVSELMRNVQAEFTRWYNTRHQRKGSFWAGRFQSTESENPLETVFYVDLNAVRAGLTDRPEKWPDSSCRMRKRGDDGWLMPLERLFHIPSRREAERLYWIHLYWRGTRPSKTGDRLLPVALAQQMEREMSERRVPRGCYLERHDGFSRGLLLGSRETVAHRRDTLRAEGVYRTHGEPVPLGVANLYALRPQRKNYLRI